MTLTIVYDNKAAREGLKADWGFAAWVKTKDGNILFDTGGDGRILLSNMRALDFNPRDIDTVVLSHDHWDHTGGLNHVLAETSDIDVYALRSFSSKTKKEIKSKARLVEVSGPQEIADGVYSTGEIVGDYKGMDIGEQALAVKTNKGVLTVVGCSHPGVDRLLESASDFGTLYGVVGGFHGFDRYEALSGLELIVPTHCTQHKKEIKKRFVNKVRSGGVGWSKEVK